MTDSRTHAFLLKAAGLSLIVLMLPAVALAATQGALRTRSC